MINDLIFTLTIGLQTNMQKREKQKHLLVSGTSLGNNKWTMKRSEENGQAGLG